MWELAIRPSREAALGDPQNSTSMMPWISGRTDKSQKSEEAVLVLLGGLFVLRQAPVVDGDRVLTGQHAHNSCNNFDRRRKQQPLS